MKIYRLLFMLLTIGFVQPAAAGFWVSRERATTIVAASVSNCTPAIVQVKDVLLPRWRRGWEGVAALCCGIAGILLFWPAIPAIMFGARGMGRGRRNRGLAIAGLVLGILDILLWFALLALFVFGLSLLL